MMHGSEVMIDMRMEVLICCMLAVGNAIGVIIAVGGLFVMQVVLLSYGSQISILIFVLSSFYIFNLYKHPNLFLNKTCFHQNLN